MEPSLSSSKRCFVVMGFGIKTDFATGRKLDLNKSYKVLIRPVVEQKGLQCFRADEIKHSGSIDLYMYRELLDADIVIADLSTANLNAFYELGIRHALRRKTTIVISEDKLAYPFDLNHVKITPYTHLGSAIDYEEVERFRKVLGDTIDAVMAHDDPDSPVYTYLQDLLPPSKKKKFARAVRAMEEEIAGFTSPGAGSIGEREESTLSILAEQGEEALKVNDFRGARTFFEAAVSRLYKNNWQSAAAPDAYLIQRLALTNYKERPENDSALKESIAMLHKLGLNHSNDTETVVLAGRIEKRLFKNGAGEEHLEKAILYFQRGYFLLHNRYNGINLALLLTRRLATNLYSAREEKIADLVWANRIRREVLEMCDRDWSTLLQMHRKGEESTANLESPRQREQDLNEEKFWILSNRAEASFGLGNFEDYAIALRELLTIPCMDWMIQAFFEEIEILRSVLQQYGELVGGWKEPVAAS